MKIPLTQDEKRSINPFAATPLQLKESERINRYDFY